MALSSWIVLDWIFALIIVVSTVFALTKGLMRELISLGALILGFVLAVLYYPVAGAPFRSLTRTDAIAWLIGFLVIFIGVLLLGAAVAFAVNKLVKAASLEWIDRLLGALFGFVRGALVASIIVLALVAFPVKEGLLQKSVLAPYLLAGARAVVYTVPRELKAKFDEQYGKIVGAWTHPGNVP